ncbi:MAG: GNAT family N-acetyltransferase [Anaerolineales bacterium]
MHIVKLRPARLEDHVSLQRICWPERSAEASQAFLARVLADLPGRGRGAVVVAQHAADVVGFGLLTYWPDVGEISDLVVGPAWRGQGIGSALIHDLSYRVAKHGLSFVEIGVAQRNKRAYALYTRLGFSWQRSVSLNLGAGLERVDYLIKPLKPLSGSDPA